VRDLQGQRGSPLKGQRLVDAFKARRRLLRADWTKRDATIAAALAEHGRAGRAAVPGLSEGNGGEPVILPQLLTEGLVIEAIEKA
jgi:thiol:disulfide interchange protein